MRDDLRYYRPQWQFHITPEVYQLYQEAKRRLVTREELGILVSNGVCETGHTIDGIHWGLCGKEPEWLRT